MKQIDDFHGFIGFYTTNVFKGKKLRPKEDEWPPRELKENDIDLFCRDIPSYEDYDRLRPIYYVGTHVIALCAAVDDKKSLRAIIERVSSLHSFL